MRIKRITANKEDTEIRGDGRNKTAISSRGVINSLVSHLIFQSAKSEVKKPGTFGLNNM